MHFTSEKFKQFVILVKIVSPINVTRQIFCAKFMIRIYDKNSLIDCELIAYALNNTVMRHMINKCIVKMCYSIFKIIFCCE